MLHVLFNGCAMVVPVPIPVFPSFGVRFVALGPRLEDHFVRGVARPWWVGQTL